MCCFTPLNPRRICERKNRNYCIYVKCGARLEHPSGTWKTLTLPGASPEEFERILLEKISSDAEMFPRRYGALAIVLYYLDGDFR